MAKNVKTPGNTKSATSQSELINDNASIVRILNQLVKRNIPLTVMIADQKTKYTSYTVSVEKSYVLLDELIPPSGNKLLQDESNINVSGKLDGVDIQFRTSLDHAVQDDKIITYYCDLPEKLEYKQRRQDYRVHIPISKHLHVFILAHDDTMIEGTLHDLSHGGAGIVLPLTNTLETKQLCKCAIELSDEEWLYCTAEIRHTKDIQPRGRQLTGIQFIDLAPAQPRLLRRSISQLEREILKKR